MNSSPNRPSHRPDRMADLMREEIASFLVNGIKDPRIGFITITQVTMTRDLQIAKVYYSAFGSDKEREQTAYALQENIGKIRHHIAKSVKTKFIPRLEFFIDEGLEQSYRVQELLGKLNTAKPSDDVLREEETDETESPEDTPPQSH